ncbi:MAG: GNAT family N-acetyltransferase [Pelagimonas sp.]|uniref:GNAT family N-acetyltransferase n=1 Tax=Pelagimonas sp. TaxID=2073170 RepID=UPI003D6C339E
MKGVSFGNAELSELKTALVWAGQEGWNPGQDDAEAFFATDPDGVFVARKNGEIIAAISVVNHDDTMAFLGLYLCKPDFRGQGVGYALWQHGLRHAGGRSIGLDGVAEQETNYAKSGFVRVGATTRFQGNISKDAAEGVRSYDPERDFASLAAMDRQSIGYGRSRFLQAWLTEDVQTRKTVVQMHNGKIAGFATIRLCQNGAKIGPVTAQDPRAALSLMRAAAASLDVSEVMVDLPNSAVPFRTSLEMLGFVKTFETARMYRGRPAQTSEICMAVATMELG